jgi:DNA-binding transcriptional ArsR family regulator
MVQTRIPTRRVGRVEGSGPAHHPAADTGSVDVRIVAGPAFEIVAELAAFTSGPARASLESGKPWIREVRANAGTELVHRVSRWGISLYGELVAFVLDAGPPYVPDQLVARIRAMPADLFVRHLLGADSATNREMVSDGAFDRAMAHERAAQTELRRAFGGDPITREALARLLRTSPRTIRSEIAGIVEAWAASVHPAFATRSAALVARDVVAKERLFRDSPVRDALRVATNGVDMDPSDWASEVVVVPTVALRPFIVPIESGSTAILLCSVADEAFDDDPAAPPRRLVQVAAALGDELRLRVLHELGSGELTASELADRLGVDRTSLHHHLGILRSAGLVAVTAHGVHSWQYTLRPGGLEAANAALTGYLRPSRSGE